MRRWLYVIIIIAAIVLVILIGYYLRYRTGTPNPGTEPAPGGLPPVGNQTNPPGLTPTPTPAPPGEIPPTSFVGQKFGLVAQNKVLSFYVDGENNAILVQPDGQIVKITGVNATTLSSSVVSGLLSANFSFDGNKILAIFGDNSSPQLSVFDVASKSWQPLSLNIKSTAWSPKDYQLAYFEEKNGVKVLTTLDISNPKAKPVELLKLHAEDLLLNWISPNQIIMSEKGSALVRGSVWSFDIKAKTLTGLVLEKPGAVSIWSGKASAGLVFAANTSRRGGKLTLYDTAGNTLTGLKLVTLPSKCTFDAIPLAVSGEVSAQTPPPATPTLKPSQPTGVTTTGKTTPTPTPQVALEKSLYCAIPRDSEKFTVSQLPDSYEKKALFTADDFYKVDLGSGAVSSFFADKTQTLDAIELKIFNQALFFINRLDQKLYVISLK